MKYVDAGYAICLSVLAAYAVVLVLWRRRLERAAAHAEAGTGAGTRTGADGPAGVTTVAGAPPLGADPDAEGVRR